MKQNNAFILPLVIISYPFGICFLGVIWYFFFKDLDGNFMGIIQGGIKNIAMFTGQVITILIILFLTTPLLNYTSNVFKNTKIIAIVFNVIVAISVLFLAIYFDLGLFSSLINKIL